MDLSFAIHSVVDLPSATTRPLHTAVGLVTVSAHITPRGWHWLPISAYSILPQSICVDSSVWDQSYGHLKVRLPQPKTNISTYGDRAFSVAATTVCTKLHTWLRYCTDLNAFMALGGPLVSTSGTWISKRFERNLYLDTALYISNWYY
jgi:hypothetical protein